jgi:hypothetical protein
MYMNKLSAEVFEDMGLHNVHERFVGNTQVTAEMDACLVDKKLCCMCQICHQNTFGHQNAA